MQAIWSARRKFETWRKIWLALAEAEHEMGLPVTPAQLAELRAAQSITDDDLARAAEHEKKLRHDVMAHVHALADVAPKASKIIHLGATSQDVNCNTELPQLRDALDLIAVKCAGVIVALAEFAREWRDTPCLAFTHFQPAQPTTIGKRAANWAYDLSLCLERIEHTRDTLLLRGLKGATGTQASFLALLDFNGKKVAQLERLFAQKLGWPPDQLLLLTGQTYPRVIDAFVLSELAATASVIHKIAGDIRLLSNHKELDEPFEEKQIGSSAMPYKRNPMRCERATSLARVVMTLAHAPLDTAATQWLERTLDDSAARRIVLPEAFLSLDGALDIMRNVAEGLIVHEGAVKRNLMAELPFMASENLMMAAVKLGRDRQQVHEAIRKHAQAAGLRVKDDGAENDLLERLSREPLMKGVDFEEALDPAAYVGLAPRQVDRFIEEVATPVKNRYRRRMGEAPELAV